MPAYSFHLPTDPLMTPLATLPASIGPTPSGTRFVRRLGPHHFAHLRACAEALDLSDCARRYLGITQGLKTMTAHQEAIDAVRAVVRRRGEFAWPAKPRSPWNQWQAGLTISWRPSS